MRGKEQLVGLSDFLAVVKLALPWQVSLLVVFYTPLLWPFHGSQKHPTPSIKSFSTDESQSGF